MSTWGRLVGVCAGFPTFCSRENRLRLWILEGKGGSTEQGADRLGSHLTSTADQPCALEYVTQNFCASVSLPVKWR